MTLLYLNDSLANITPKQISIFQYDKIKKDNKSKNERYKLLA